MVTIKKIDCPVCRNTIEKHDVFAKARCFDLLIEKIEENKRKSGVGGGGGGAASAKDDGTGGWLT